MIVHAKFSALGESRWYEYLVRFVLGGLTTMVAGVVADLYGPQMGGLFLAFPAIFCGSATLIETRPIGPQSAAELLAAAVCPTASLPVRGRRSGCEQPRLLIGEYARKARRISGAVDGDPEKPARAS